MKGHFESDIFNRPIETQLSLLGKMQAQNAAQAAITVRKIFPNLSEDIIERGLAKAKLPGRFEIIENVKNYGQIKHLILDGAHTCNSIRLTLDTLHKLYQNQKVNLLFACAADKDVNDMAPILKDNYKKRKYRLDKLRKVVDNNDNNNRLDILRKYWNIWKNNKGLYEKYSIIIQKEIRKLISRRKLGNIK